MTVLIIAVAAFLMLFGMVVFYGAPYVPSRKYYIQQAFKHLYMPSKKDMLVDLGSGDGVVLREAAKLGAKTVGYEMNPVLVMVSRWLSRKNNRVNIYWTNFWRSQLPKRTTVVYVFSITKDDKKVVSWLQKEVNRLGNKVRVISYGIKLPGVKTVATHGAYYLYEITPLQSENA